MAITPYSGQLKSNEVFASIFNMIIGQSVNANVIKGTSSKLADMFKVEGSRYGDTKLIYDVDILKTTPWGKDADTNILELNRPDDPFCQPIVVDQFRQIALTIDNFLSKRAFSTEGAFAQFTSVMLGMLSETKRVYDATLINNYVGSTSSTIGKQTVLVDYPVADSTSTNVSTEAYNRLVAETIAEVVANTFVELTDISRSYNDLGFLRSYSKDELVVVWNSAVVNQLKKLDMPTIYNQAGLIDKFEEVVLSERYFYAPTSASVPISTYASETTPDLACANIEMDVKYEGGADQRVIHYFPGDMIDREVPSLSDGRMLTIAKYAPDSGSESVNFAKGHIKKKGDKAVICKIMAKDSLPYMSGFEIGTSFMNPKSLTENHWLIFAHNTLEYLHGKPWITIKQK